MLPNTARLTLDVTSLVGVNGYSVTVYDPQGVPVGGESSGVSSASGNPLVLNVPLRAALAPGVYAVGFTLTDAGGLRTQYGYPGGHGLPVPGGPLLIAVG
ncbi:hypothetical protein [Streptomyces sp. NPDC020983]|uniref:hypothetical protein n=1 Tax=Streptomyces sp. NPDC020983 TaxID=3365106 RepID=UPI003796501B